MNPRPRQKHSKAISASQCRQNDTGSYGYHIRQPSRRPRHCPARQARADPRALLFVLSTFCRGSAAGFWNCVGLLEDQRGGGGGRGGGGRGGGERGGGG